MSHHPQSDQQANGTLSTLLLSGKSLRIGLKFFGPGFFVPAINPSLRLSEAAIEEDTRSQQLSLSLSRPPEAAPWPRSPVFVPVKIRSLTLDFHIINCMLVFPSQLNFDPPIFRSPIVF
ncbi:hypothetical protein ACFX2I_015537 [Malus domestica]